MLPSWLIIGPMSLVFHEMSLLSALMTALFTVILGKKLAYKPVTFCRCFASGYDFFFMHHWYNSGPCVCFVLWFGVFQDILRSRGHICWWTSIAATWTVDNHVELQSFSWQSAVNLWASGLCFVLASGYHWYIFATHQFSALIVPETQLAEPAVIWLLTFGGAVDFTIGVTQSYLCLNLNIHIYHVTK